MKWSPPTDNPDMVTFDADDALSAIATPLMDALARQDGRASELISDILRFGGVQTEDRLTLMRELCAVADNALRSLPTREAVGP